MRAIQIVRKILQITWLGVPFFLISVTLGMWILKTGGQLDDSINGLVLWKYLRDKLYFVYAYGSVLPFLFFLSGKERTAIQLWREYRPWIIGLLLTLFSYAISGFIVDLSYTGVYIWMALSGKRVI